MATTHHGRGSEEHDRLLRRLMEQSRGAAEQLFPDGKLNEGDEGELAYMIAADKKNQVIVIDFLKPVTWLGLDVESAESLRDLLTEKLMELRGIDPGN